ncbi:hypothetical protein F5X68DRAFT_261461 [Plectosphaerella plurivora]|uniref:Uncharacterized protein n=1 Tax=Plectosphaerella plurivora TaxID=936078 RepID=A0A9P8VBZ5_9PEZI|nr:hypothetical protein F5X68DRAFT_261461 [Plectosphaerella plurivora]
MTSRTTSPRRRHILSSINPDSDDAGSKSRRRRRSRSPSRRHESEEKESRRSRRREGEEATSDHGDEGDQNPKKRDYGDEQRSDDELRPRSKKFRFKKRSHRDRDRESKDPSTSSRSHRRRHHRSRSPTPTNPHAPRALSPDTAFRESLFDAMADDEGAAYWEGVYGQPVHVYASEAAGPTGELEQMNDEEYATWGNWGKSSSRTVATGPDLPQAAASPLAGKLDVLHHSYQFEMKMFC